MTEFKYKIKPHFSIIAHSPNRVELRHGIWNPISFYLNDKDSEGKLYSILKDLDGTRTSLELSKMHQISISQLEGLIDYLKQLDVLEKGQHDLFFSTHSPILSKGGTAVTQNAQKKVLLIGDSQLKNAISSILEESLPKNNVVILPEQDPIIEKLSVISENDWLYDGISFLKTVDQFSDLKDYFVVLAFSNIDPAIALKFNKIAYELGIEWIHVAIDGPFLFVGPTFLAKDSPCYACLEKRITMNLREHASYQKYKTALVEKQVHKQPFVLNQAIISLIASHTAIEILNFIYTQSTFTVRKLLNIYLPTMEMAYNELLSLSSCQTCGADQYKSDKQLYFDMQTLLESSTA